MCLGFRCSGCSLKVRERAIFSAKSALMSICAVVVRSRPMLSVDENEDVSNQSQIIAAAQEFFRKRIYNETIRVHPI